MKQKFLLALGCLLVGSSLAFYRSLSIKVPVTQRQLDLAPGQSFNQITDQLDRAGLIANRRSWWLYLTLTGKRRQLQAGIQTLPAKLSTLDLVRLLTTNQANQIKITFPEGLRLTDIAQIVQQKLDIDSATFLAAAPVEEYEGRLWSDTYYFKTDVTASEIVSRLHLTWQSKTKALNLTDDQIILASIVERETRRDADRPLIAAVYLNRLKIGMKLDADPTVQYAKGSWLPLKLADYQAVKSKYNTYLNNGLPPHPIATASLKSYQAVLKPATHDYYYFLSDAEGELHLAKTLAEHNANRARY